MTTYETSIPRLLPDTRDHYKAELMARKLANGETVFASWLSKLTGAHVVGATMTGGKVRLICRM